jgi:hypothetical protein
MKNKSITLMINNIYFQFDKLYYLHQNKVIILGLDNN